MGSRDFLRVLMVVTIVWIYMLRRHIYYNAEGSILRHSRHFGYGLRNGMVCTVPVIIVTVIFAAVTLRWRNRLSDDI